MGVVMVDWRDPRRGGEITLKQRQLTSFSHLQCQIVDVHLQSGVSRYQFIRVPLDRLNTFQKHCRL